MSPQDRYPGHTRAWYACFNAVLREFPSSEIGEEAYELAARAASTICYHPSEQPPQAGASGANAGRKP